MKYKEEQIKKIIQDNLSFILSMKEGLYPARNLVDYIEEHIDYETYDEKVWCVLWGLHVFEENEFIYCIENTFIPIEDFEAITK